MRTAIGGPWARAAVLGLLVVAGLVLALPLDLPAVGPVRGWVDGAGPGTWAGLVLGVAVFLMAPVPRSAVSVLLGVVAGFQAGVAVALAGGLLGGLAAFGLARLLGRPAVARLAGRRIDAVDRLMAGRGFRALLVGRLVPVIPFVAVSYGAGLTAVRLLPYALATVVGIVPSTLVQVGVGASAGAVTDVVPTAAGVAAIVGAAGLLWWRRRPKRNPQVVGRVGLEPTTQGL